MTPLHAVKPSIMALVPARGGSKGILRKNLRLLDGRPLVVHAIEAGLACPLIDRVVVSTDDPEIAETALKSGADVPFMRPDAFATDAATDLEVFQHCLDELMALEDYEPELIVQLRPTAPLRRPGTLVAAIECMLQSDGADSLRTVRLAPFTPYKMWSIDSWHLRPVMRLSGVTDFFDGPRQALPDVFVQDGFVDIVRPRTVRSGSMAGATVLAFPNPDPTVDIDDPESLEAAQRMYSARSPKQANLQALDQRIGILQGRLVPSATGQLQCHPGRAWPSEFTAAGKIALSHIELLAERTRSADNPIWTKSGREQLSETARVAGVGLSTLCVDESLESPIDDLRFGQDLAMRLEEVASDLRLSIIVIPLMEASSPERLDLGSAAKAVRSLASTINRHGTRIALELNLPASDSLRILGMVASDSVGLCLDTGNLATSGIDPTTELEKLGPHVIHVHIKDKDIDGENVELGKGLVDFSSFFSIAQEQRYNGLFTLETTRLDDPVEAARDHRLYVVEHGVTGGQTT